MADKNGEKPQNMYTKKKDKSKSQEIVYYVVLPLPSRDRPYVRSTENLNFIFVFFVKISDFFRQYLFGHGGAHIQAAEGGRDSVGKNPTPPPFPPECRRQEVAERRRRWTPLRRRALAGIPFEGGRDNLKFSPTPLTKYPSPSSLFKSS